MTPRIADDYAAIRLRAEQIARGEEPVVIKPDCPTCGDRGWVCVVTTSPVKFDVCFSCGNPKGRVMP